MSAWAPQAGAPAELARAAEAPRDSLGPRLAAFFGLAAFASLQYATLLLHPPVARLLAVVAIATAGGAGLALSGRIESPTPLATAMRGLLVLMTLVLALLASGVPAHMLMPGAWHTLDHNIGRGFSELEGWLWPYRGGDRWARLTVVLIVPAGSVTAAGVCFWPSERAAGARRLVALALLLAIFLTGVANETGPAWGFQGVVLVALVAAWLWLATLRAADANRAAWWLLGCSALALAMAPALSAHEPWIDYRAWNPVERSDAFQWDQLYGPLAWSRSTATMFEVAERRPALLRVTSLDRFDGLRFLRSDSPPGSPGLDLGRAPGEDRWYERATFTVGALSSSLLVSGAGTPVQARWLSAGAQSMHRESDGTTVFATTPTQGNRYEVSSYAPTPTAAALRRAPPRFPRAYLPYAQFELPNASASALRPADLRAEESARPSPASLVGASAPGRTPASDPAIARRIETSPYGPMFALARRLAVGARTGYDVAERIERFLLAGYAYGENVPRRRYPLVAFLFGDARGYCQQFSGAMTLMLRMDGIPARVAAGFAPGIYNPRTARWRVRALDAHSWVEVYFSGIGWVPFDPTPPRPAPSSLAAGGGLVSSANGTHGGGRGLHGGLHGSGPAALGSARPGPRGPGGASSWLLAAIGLAALLALLAACWWIAGARRLRRGLAGDASGAVAELRWALARVGQPIPPATTLAQLEARLSLARGGPASGYLRLLRELRYRADGAPGPSPRQRGGLRRALGGQGPLARVRALLALPPGATRRRSSPSP